MAGQTLDAILPLEAAEGRLAAVEAQAGGIHASKIWKTLVWVAGLAQRLGIGRAQP